ncbi:MAG: serine/threonine protein kinase [Deltaproteobacteria bacterium]|nr:serine/threonine protein kinase [Deltaproteobacteria bacterium]MDQ3299597.1 serine/threonine protein kinase [Myxococcota bacterium]
MPDILAIVSKAIFERDARVAGKLVGPGDVWPVDRYTSANKALQGLANGGRIFLVTVRPPNEQLWLVGVVETPSFDGSAWIAPRPNARPVTNITALRRTIEFESGKGMSQDKGTLGMSLQAPRTLTARDSAQILAAIDGHASEASTPLSSPRAKPARIIGGKYEIVRELGRGGMGVVYEARHTTTGRRVAIKEIVGEGVSKDKKLLERFQREARATSAIETQHIAPVIDAGSDPATEHPYLVMELLDGKDLQHLLTHAGPLPEFIAVRIVAQACAGLARAHAAGVVHRDIKPANLFLARRDGEVIVKVLDFGVARVKEDLGTVEHRLTSTGVMLGTPLYMSPEQVQGMKDLDHRTDLWSLGIVLHEALTGTTPHAEAETLGSLVVAICARPAKPVRTHAPHLGEAVCAIVDRSLLLDPAARYATADELLSDLRRLLPDGMTLDASMLDALPTDWSDDLDVSGSDATARH